MVIFRYIFWITKQCALIILPVFNFMRPILGSMGACKFDINCADLAQHAFANYPLHTAFMVTARQLLRCHPFERQFTMATQVITWLPKKCIRALKSNL